MHTVIHTPVNVFMGFWEEGEGGRAGGGQLRPEHGRVRGDWLQNPEVECFDMQHYSMQRKTPGGIEASHDEPLLVLLPPSRFLDNSLVSFVPPALKAAITPHPLSLLLIFNIENIRKL